MLEQDKDHFTVSAKNIGKRSPKKQLGLAEPLHILLTASGEIRTQPVPALLPAGSSHKRSVC